MFNTYSTFEIPAPSYQLGFVQGKFLSTNNTSDPLYFFREQDRVPAKYSEAKTHL